jgi:hypothetical protein
MATMKTYLVMYVSSQAIMVIFIDEDTIIDAYFNPTSNYILGFSEFLKWYDTVAHHGIGSVAVTESGYPIVFYDKQSWLMIEALDEFDAVKKAETILHERIRH